MTLLVCLRCGGPPGEAYGVESCERGLYDDFGVEYAVCGGKYGTPAEAEAAAERRAWRHAHPEEVRKEYIANIEHRLRGVLADVFPEVAWPTGSFTSGYHRRDYVRAELNGRVVDVHVASGGCSCWTRGTGSDDNRLLSAVSGPGEVAIREALRQAGWTNDLIRKDN